MPPINHYRNISRRAKPMHYNSHGIARLSKRLISMQRFSIVKQQMVRWLRDCSRDAERHAEC